MNRESNNDFIMNFMARQQSEREQVPFYESDRRDLFNSAISQQQPSYNSDGSVSRFPHWLDASSNPNRGIEMARIFYDQCGRNNPPSSQEFLHRNRVDEGMFFQGVLGQQQHLHDQLARQSGYRDASFFDQINRAQREGHITSSEANQMHTFRHIRNNDAEHYSGPWPRP